MQVFLELPLLELANLLLVLEGVLLVKIWGIRLEVALGLAKLTHWLSICTTLIQLSVLGQILSAIIKHGNYYKK